MDVDRNRLVLEVATEGFWDWDVKADRAYLSPRYCQLIGYSPDDTVFDTAFLKRVIHPDDHEHAFGTLTEHMREKRDTTVLQYRLITKDRNVIWVEARGKTVEFDEDGNPSRMVGTVVNITERKRIEELLRTSEDRFRSIMELSPDIISIISEQGILIYNSPAALAIHGYANEEMIGRDTFELIHPDDQPLVRGAMEKLLNDPSRHVSVQYRYRHKNGTYAWMEATASNHLKNPNVRGLVVISRDITERKVAEETLRTSADEVHDLYNHAPCGFHSLDKDGKFIRINDTELQWLGYARDEILGRKNFADLVTARSRLNFEVDFPRFKASGLVRDLEIDMVRRDGTILPVLLNATAIYDDAGNYLMSRATVYDITERKVAETERERYFKFFATSSELMCIAGTDGYFKKVNPSFSRTLGYAEEELLTMPLMEFIHPDDRQPTRNEIERQLRGDFFTASFENRYLCKGGGFRWLSWNAFYNEDEGVIFGVARDVTEKKQVDIELAAAKEAAESASRAKSRFLANMSHEIRTPLNGIVGMAQLLSFTELSPRQKEYLEVMRTSSESLLSLISDVLDLSRIETGKVELELQVFSLRKSIEDVVKTQTYLIRDKGLAIRTDIPDDVPDGLAGDELRLKQVLLNLVGNAVKFTPMGSITLSVAVEERHTDRASLRFDVTDTGIGIRPEVMDTIFAPFNQADASTTRRFGGSGLGLSICSGLVELMGGTIWVESVEGTGSTFHVLLPFAVDEGELARHAHHRTDADLHPPTWEGGPLRVLVAEDNGSNRMFCETLLRMGGHHLDTARNGAEALKKWICGAFDIILMDVQMPDMDGIEATRIIRERERETGGHIPIVALTAHALREDRALLLGQGFDGYLAKPLQVMELNRELRRCLHREGNGPVVRRPRASEGG